MRAAFPFRICAVVLVVFAALHTFGFLRYTPATPEGVAVKISMDDVRFPFASTTRTYGDLYRGFGYFVSAYLLFAALVAWQLPTLLAASRESFRILAIGLLAAQTAAVVLSLIFFAMPQAIFSIAVVACVAWGLVAAGSS
ncbi:MAG TPA: hypothetical protein VGO46_06145 [Gemmatimonadaceae bacterium]|jgi:hypothetical protein|nr:hypothetical protein [Gemmatimonadaceae bacterium]